MRKYNPSKQMEMLKHIDAAMVGEYPTIHQLQQDLGEEAAESWLQIQLYDLSEYAGVKEKLSAQHSQVVAQAIFATFGYLKAPELMAFFARFKGGEYGRFYGAVDALVITEALHKFVGQRNDRLHAIYEEQRKEQERKEKERRKQCGLTREQFSKLPAEEIKKLKQQMEREKPNLPL